VIVRAVEPGQTINTSNPVLVLSDRLIVKAQVDETDIGRVKIGQPAIISLDAYPEQQVKAKVDHIAYESKTVNNVTIYEVDILPVRVPEVFRSGMSANVNIVEMSKEDVLLLPVNAVKEDKKGSYVLLSKGADSKPLKCRIITGISDDEKIEVVSGLEEKDKILVKTKKYTLTNTKRTNNSPFIPFGRKKAPKK